MLEAPHVSNIHYLHFACLQTLPQSAAFFLPTDANDPSAFQYPPELCHFISTELAVNTSASGLVPPSQFATYGMDISLAAAEAWMTAATGATTLMCASACAQGGGTSLLPAALLEVCRHAC